ncbi:hypothetical protein HAZT_HAZT012266 [Hyalella azteca]|uniref:Histamine H1 receptor n=1 Tax=Hyalella azteca TaxID=294128 RepID=A0A6A0H2U9_HYAAZ|nr:hypothetical protein HAZT_HAZT012266 [Hyalella azteca]
MIQNLSDLLQGTATASAAPSFDNRNDEGYGWKETDYSGHLAAGLGLVLLATITTLGNSLVIHAIRTEKRLRTFNGPFNSSIHAQVSNLFLMSLAVADLIIGVIVMPITAAYTITGQWLWGEDVCKFWLATDYTASTASIFNLVVLTLDRYWSVMAPLRYLRRRTRKRALLLIGGAWAAASLWLLPVLFWSSFSPGARAQRKPLECETDFAHNILFKLVTSALNFYVPSALIVILYYRIFRTIQKRTASFPQTDHHQHETLQQTTSTSSETLGEKSNNRRNFKRTSGRSTFNEKESIGVRVETFEALTVVGADEEPNSASCFKGVTVQVEYLSDRSHHMHHRACYPPCHMQGLSSHVNNPPKCGEGSKSKYYRKTLPTLLSSGSTSNVPGCSTHAASFKNAALTKSRKPGNLNLAKERKAARQLGVIMGVFLACWLPYFTIFPVIALCSSCVPYSAHMATISLGYLNSALNPAIYPLCNHHFRRAFQRMVRCHDRQQHSEHCISTLPLTTH